MSYKVLARKWRPGNFSEVVGQQHILQSLSHALDSDRLHHALLFTGTRGVGKTTIARILAKALNCEQGVSSTPCGECESCLAIDEGRYIDLIEVDAASRTKVDDTRELLDNVQYLPTSGRYKVYLIDEVHMLSRSSFNALLKTLEEPPDHVKFLLATTDPQKLPVTVLSRCLQFNLKRLDPEQIKTQLAQILVTEHIESDDESLELLARCADGSMRDGLSLLDQAISFGAGKVIKEDVRKMLGSIEQRYIHALIESLANEDSIALFKAIDDAADRSPDFNMVLDELLDTFYQLSLVQLAPEIIDQRSLDRQWLKQTSTEFSAEQLQLYYQICLTGKRDLPLAPDSRTGFEMLMLRMLAFRPDTITRQEQPSSANAGKKTPVRQHIGQQDVSHQHAVDKTAGNLDSDENDFNRSSVDELRPVAYQVPADRNVSANSSNTDSSDNSVKINEVSSLAEDQGISSTASSNKDSSNKDTFAKVSAIDRKWSELVESLPVTGLTRQLVLHMSPAVWNDSVLELVIDVEQQTIYSKEREKELIKALRNHVEEDVTVTIRIDNPVAETPAQQKKRQAKEQQQAAEQSINTDPAVKKMTEAFGASVAPSSIRPVN
jgi:DNA polymerase-3 subunit gamma/tau